MVMKHQAMQHREQRSKARPSSEPSCVSATHSMVHQISCTVASAPHCSTTYSRGVLSGSARCKEYAEGDRTTTTAILLAARAIDHYHCPRRVLLLTASGPIPFPQLPDSSQLYTANLNVNYRRPVPQNEAYYVELEADRIEKGKKVFLKAALYDKNGQSLVDATCLYILVPKRIG